MTMIDSGRLAVLSVSVLAALAASLAAGTPAARAEPDDHASRQNAREVDVFHEFNRGPCGYDPEPVHGQPACPLPPYAAPPAAPPPVFAPPVYAPPVNVTPVYAPPPSAPVLSDVEIRRALQRQGYRRIGDIVFDRDSYTARARDRRNQPVLLVGSAATGAVVDRRRLR
ncbi:MAG: hypothetical protein L6R19_24675 [Alphaproteobacteria bacterium]|nr:hypothetical protein [Alphaproteobacteria bacterium]